MINAGILDGDHVIVQQQSSADNGDMVVALVDDSATVKTFYKEEDHYRLQPQNDAFSPIIVKHCEISARLSALSVWICNLYLSGRFVQQTFHILFSVLDTACITAISRQLTSVFRSSDVS